VGRPGEDVQHGKETQRPTRSFKPEFKAEVVELCRAGDRMIGQVARNETQATAGGWQKVGSFIVPAAISPLHLD
jgi:hypothetical protein